MYKRQEYCFLYRCNFKNEQVFYGSVSPGTCLNEIKDLQRREHVRLGLWKARREFVYFHTCNEPRNSTEKIVFSELASLFSNEGDQYYEQTAGITDWVFSQEFPNISVSGIAYPSTLPSKNGERPLNFALQKSYVDGGHLSLDGWYQYEVAEKHSDKYVVREICKGASKEGILDFNKELEWVDTPESSVLVPPDTSVKFQWDGNFWIADKDLPGIKTLRNIGR